MITEVYQVYCEWDIGQEYVMFASEAAAWKWAEEMLIEGDFEEPIDELAGEGLVGVNSLNLIY